MLSYNINDTSENENDDTSNNNDDDDEQNEKDDAEQRQMLKESINKAVKAREECSSNYRKSNPEQFLTPESKAANKARFSQLYTVISSLNKKLNLLKSDRDEYYRLYNDKAKTAANKADKTKQFTQMVSNTYKRAKDRVNREQQEKEDQKKSGSKPMTPMTATEILEINTNTSSSLKRRQTDYQRLTKRVERVEKINREEVNTQQLQDYINIAMHLVTTKKIIEEKNPGKKISVNDVDKELNPSGSKQSKTKEIKNGQLIHLGEIVIHHQVYDFWKDSPLVFSYLAAGVGSGINSPLDLAFTSLGKEKCKIWSLPLLMNSESDSGESKRSRPRSNANSSRSNGNASERKTSKRSRLRSTRHR